jgi:hypothetical protein
MIVFAIGPQSTAPRYYSPRLNGYGDKFSLGSRNIGSYALVGVRGRLPFRETSMLSFKKIGLAALAVATIAGSTMAMTDMAGARGFGRGGGGGGFRGGGGGGFHGGGFRGGRGFGIGAGVATGLAIGALGAGYGYSRYGYGYPAYGAYGYDDGYYGGDCVLRRRVHYTPYGPVVRHVRVCY